MHARIVAMALVGSAIAGCGSEPVSHEQYVAKADAICADANEKETALEPGAVGWTYGPKFTDGDFLARFNAVGRSALDRLREISQPEPDREKIAAFLDSTSRSVGAMEAQVRALKAGTRDETAKHTDDYVAAYGDQMVAAGRLGLRECQGLSN